MKKTILILMFISLFLGCEKEEIEPFFVGNWTTFLPTDEANTDKINVRFIIVDNYNVREITYPMKSFRFFDYDSTIIFDVHYKTSHVIKYNGKWDSLLEVFNGNAYHYINNRFSYKNENIQTYRE